MANSSTGKSGVAGLGSLQNKEQDAVNTTP